MTANFRKYILIGLFFGLVFFAFTPIKVLGATSSTIKVNYTYYNNLGQKVTKTKGTYRVTNGKSFSLASNAMPNVAGNTRAGVKSFKVTKSQTVTVGYERNNYTLTQVMENSAKQSLATPKKISVPYGANATSNVPTQLSYNNNYYFLPVAQTTQRITGNKTIYFTYYQPTLTNIKNNVVSDTRYTGNNYLPVETDRQVLIDALNPVSYPTTYKQLSGTLGVAKNSYGINVTNLTYKVGSTTRQAKQTDFINFTSSNPNVIKVNATTGDIQSIAPGSVTITATFKWNTAEKVSFPVTVTSHDTQETVVLKDYLTNQTLQMYWLSSAIVAQAQKELPLILASNNATMSSSQIDKYNALRNWLAKQPYDYLLCAATDATTQAQLNSIYSFEKDPNSDILDYIPLLDTLSMIDDSANDTILDVHSGVSLKTDNLLHVTYTFSDNGQNESYVGTGSGIGICQDYSDAFTLLANLAGIKATTITSSSLDHAWNAVNIDNQWYETDLTWMNSNYQSGGVVNGFSKLYDYNPGSSAPSVAEFDNVPINALGQPVITSSDGGVYAINANGDAVSTKAPNGYQYDLNSDAVMLYSHGAAIDNYYGSPNPDAPFASALKAQALANYPTP